MSTLDYISRDIIDRFFNEGGYVMDFTTDQFDSFTCSSVGFGICEKYNLSKGKSLREFVKKENDQIVKALLCDLLEYFDYKFKDLLRDDPDKAELYEECKTIEQSLCKINDVYTNQVNQIKKEFSSDYINDQIKIMTDYIEKNPTEAIGKSKELLESCCKTILFNSGVEIDKDWTVQKLTKETLGILQLTPDDIDDSKKGSETIKKILGNLSTICSGMAELRNPYGSGHGKKADYRGLSPRHARLATGASAAVVLFLWETYNIGKN